MNKDLSENDSVLSFSQDSAFYLRSGKKQAEEGNLISALGKIRKAHEIEPNNIENIVSLAEILNRMQRYEESARVLLMNNSPESLSSDGLFGLVSNFLGMEEFLPAKVCLLLYLKRYPNDRYANTCRDYLALFADTEEFAWQLGLEEGESIELITDIHLSKAMHFSYLDKESLHFLYSLEERFPDSLWLQMEIALGEYSLNMQKEAEFRSINILKKNKDYLRAKCLQSYIRLNNNKKYEAIEILDDIRIPDEPDLEGLGMLSSVLLEAGLYEKAENCAETLLSYLPYDSLALHQSAFAKYMLGRREEALELYRSISIMDSHDTVAGYYIDWIAAHPDPRDGVKGFFTSYDVSYGEAIQRFNMLGHLFDNGVDEAIKKWENDQRLQDLFKWALSTPFLQSKKSVFCSLTALGGKKCVDMLRDYLLKLDQPDEDKQRAVTSLHLLGVSGPFSVYFRGNWQFNVDTRPLPDDVPYIYRKLKEKLLHLPENTRYKKDTAEIALRYYDFYIQSLQGRYPRLNIFQADAMVAALVYIALETQQRAESCETVAGEFSVSLRRMNNAVDRLMAHLTDDQNDGED